jgi:oligopeptide/dipeptide ABC transporter ATP-binding protein
VEHMSTEFATRSGTVRAVRDISFQVRRGEVLGIVGESGSGKSVTARSIIQLVPPPGRVVQGAVQFKGRNLVGLPERELRRVRGAEIAMVLQEPMTSLNPVLTIGTQLGEMFEHHAERAPRGGSARSRSAQLLSRVGIPDPVRRLASYPFGFSGGMRQRTCIAMGLACNPDLIIADEPTTALDVTIQAQVLDLLAELRRELGVSIVLITHDLGVVAELCDSVAVMYAGQIVEYADVFTLFATPRHPYTRALLGSLPRLGGARLRRQATIDGQPPDMTALPGGCAFAPRCPLADARCVAEEPPLVLFDDGGTPATARCWHAGKTTTTAAAGLPVEAQA